MMSKIVGRRWVPIIIFGVTLVGLSLKVSAQERKIETEVLAKSTTDWRGVLLPAYSEGQPEVTVARITIPKGMC